MEKKARRRRLKRLVVLVPTFNEQDNIAVFLQEVLNQRPNLPNYKMHILVSDSHSQDETRKIAQQYARRYKTVHYLDVVKRGLGFGLVKGLDAAIKKHRADVVVTLEADLSCDPRQLPEFLSRLEKVDLVVGSRYCPGGKIVNWSWWRRALSLGANFLLRVLAATSKVHEFTNLYRAFRRDVWRQLRPKLWWHRDWIFVPAFVFAALDTDFTIAEQPIIYHDRFGGRSKMRTLSYTKNLLRYALKFRWSKLKIWLTS